MSSKMRDFQKLNATNLEVEPDVEIKSFKFKDGVEYNIALPTALTFKDKFNEELEEFEKFIKGVEAESFFLVLSDNCSRDCLYIDTIIESEIDDKVKNIIQNEDKFIITLTNGQVNGELPNILLYDIEVEDDKIVKVTNYYVTNNSGRGFKYVSNNFPIKYNDDENENGLAVVDFEFTNLSLLEVNKLVIKSLQAKVKIRELGYDLDDIIIRNGKIFDGDGISLYEK